MNAALIQDQVLGRGVEYRFRVEFAEDNVTVAGLIESRVRKEVEAYNRDPQAVFNGLVQPTDAEARLNAYDKKRSTKRSIDADRQVARALKAFNDNQIIVIVGDTQAESLEQEVAVDNEPTVTFLRLTQLVGG